MTELRVSEVRRSFEEVRRLLPAIYSALDWEQKGTLLRAIIEAGDHPPAFAVTFDVSRATAAEVEYLKCIGIGPFPDGGDADAR